MYEKGRKSKVLLTEYEAESRAIKRDLLLSGKYGMKIVTDKRHKPIKHKKKEMDLCLK